MTPDPYNLTGRSNDPRDVAMITTFVDFILVGLVLIAVLLGLAHVAVIPELVRACCRAFAFGVGAGVAVFMVALIYETCCAMRSEARED